MPRIYIHQLHSHNTKTETIPLSFHNTYISQSTKVTAQIVKSNDCCTEGRYSFSHISKHMIFTINVLKMAPEETEL